MSNKNSVKLLIGTAVVGGLLSPHIGHARALRDAPELPSIEINFDVIERLKAEEKQKIADQKAADAKKKKEQLAQKKAKEKAANVAKKDAQKTKVAAAPKKKEEKKLAKNTVKPAPEKKQKLETELAKKIENEIAKKEDKTKEVAAAPAIVAAPIVHEAPKNEPVSIVNTEKKPELPAIAAPAIPFENKLASIEKKEPEKKIEKPAEDKKPVTHENKAPELAKETPKEPEKKLEVAEAKPEAPAAPAAPIAGSDEEKISLIKKMFGMEDKQKPAEVAAVKAEEKPTAPVEAPKLAELPKPEKIALPAEPVKELKLEEKPAEPAKLAAVEPAIPPLAEVVELKPIKNISEHEAPKAEETLIKPENPRAVISKNLPPENMPVKTSFLTPVFDWLYSFKKNQAVDISDLNLNTTATANNTKPAGHRLEALDSSPKYLEDLAARNAAPVPVTSDADINFVAHDDSKTEAKIADASSPSDKIKEISSFEPTALPQVEEIVAPTIDKKSADGSALSLIFEGSDVDVSNANNERLAKLVKKLSSTDQKVKIVSYAITSGHDANASKRISLKRAIAVRTKMIEAGLDTARINVQAGSEQTKKSPNGVSIFLVDGNL